MSYSNRMQKNHVYSEFLCPRGRDRIYDLGIQIAQLYLSPFDRIIGFIGEASSGKSALVKGMFPGLELTNDDDGVNIRPLPLLDQDSLLPTATMWIYALKWLLLPCRSLRRRL